MILYTEVRLYQLLISMRHLFVLLQMPH